MNPRQVVAVIFLGAGAALAPVPASAQVQVAAPILVKIGTLLVEGGVQWAAGKVLDYTVDRAKGLKMQRELEDVEADLQTQLARGAGDRMKIKKNLQAAKNELAYLHHLMDGVDPAQLAKDKAKVSRDLRSLQKELAEHEKRLDKHDKRLDDQQSQIDDKQSQIDNQKRQLEELKKQFEGRPYEGSHTYSVPVPPAPLRHGEVSLVVKILGRSNFVRLLEATHPVRSGNFKLSSNGTIAAYFVPPGTRAVVELFAPDTHIVIPMQLMGQVEILSNGFQYKTLVN